MSEVKRGWDREDIKAEPFRVWGAKQTLASIGGEPPTLKDIMAAVDRREATGYGPDVSLIDSALHLPIDQFEAVESRVKKLKLNLPTRRRHR